MCAQNNSQTPYLRALHVMNKSLCKNNSSYMKSLQIIYWCMPTVSVIKAMTVMHMGLHGMIQDHVKLLLHVGLLYFHLLSVL